MATVEQHLSAEQKELVAVGASVGAGCHPCVDHHLKAGANRGLEGEQLLAAVTSAERVTAEAAVSMGDHVRARLGPTVTAPALLSQLEQALASLGAALGANDKQNIERQLRIALDLGASRPQLEQAIETGHTVQENAARIHQREATRLLDSLTEPTAAREHETASGPGSGCSAHNEPDAGPAEAPQGELEPADSCGCGADDEHNTQARASASATSGPAAGCAGPMAELFTGGSAGETSGMAAAMANCRRMFAGIAPAPAATNEPSTATEPAGSGTKEV